MANLRASEESVWSAAQSRFASLAAHLLSSARSLWSALNC
jgi:hypothetical protein